MMSSSFCPVPKTALVAEKLVFNSPSTFSTNFEKLSSLKMNTLLSGIFGVGTTDTPKNLN